MTEEAKTDSLELKVKKMIEGIKGILDAKPLAQPFRVTLPMLDKELTPLMDEYYNTMLASGNLRTKFKGFRDGNVPKDMVIQHNGGFIRFYESLFIEMLRRWLDKNEKQICSYYDMQLDGNAKDGFKLGATVYFMPKVTLPKSLTFLKTQEVKSVDADLVAQRVDAYVKQERFKTATFEPDPAPISTGHQVAVKIETRCGKKLDKRRTGVFTAIMADASVASWWQGFVIGLKQGDVTEQTLVETDPNSKFFDKSLTAQIMVQSVQRVILPPIDAKFLEQHGVRVESGWRRQIHERFFNVAKQGVDNEMALSAIDAILMKAKVDPLPSIWIESIVQQSVANITAKVGKANLLKLYNATTQVQLVSNMQAQTFIELRDEMVLKAFAIKKKIDVFADGWIQVAKSGLADYICSLKAKETELSSGDKK